jgi:hypothetical protein
MRRRLAVLGISGVVLIAMTAGAIQIYHLEQRVASLEAAAHSPAKVADIPVATVRGPLDVIYTPAGKDQLALQAPGPPPLGGPTPHEINGMTYYVLPLAATSTIDDVTIRR